MKPFVDPPPDNPPASPASPEPRADDKSGFRCYICGEPSEEICMRCTRDSCGNHLCERCNYCSDCCICG